MALVIVLPSLYSIGVGTVFQRGMPLVHLQNVGCQDSEKEISTENDDSRRYAIPSIIPHVALALVQ